MNPFSVRTPSKYRNTSRVVKVLSLALLSSLFAGSLHAATNNSGVNDEDIITVNAEQAELDGLNHTTTYNGNVVMKKGAMRVDADTVVFREQEGTTTYSGNVIVEMDTDTVRIEADEVIIHNDGRKVSQITALGRPARYQQKPRGQSKLVIAKANTLEYQLQEETLHLIENASLEQDGSSLSGNRIDYDVRQSVVKAGSSVDQKERVHMVIPPGAFQPTPRATDAEKAATPRSEASTDTSVNPSGPSVQTENEVPPSLDTSE